MGRTSQPTPPDNTTLILENEHYKSTLHNGRVELEALFGDGSASDEGQQRRTYSFPEKRYAVGDITCLGLTLEFLVFGKRSGSIFYYYLDKQGPLAVNEYRHVDCGILRLWLNTSGSRLIFEDEDHHLYLYNPVNDQMLTIPEFSGTLEVVLWDASDSRVFVLAERSQNFVYVYSPINLCCPNVTFLGASTRPGCYHPLALDNGMLKCQIESGVTKDMVLPTHQWKHKAVHGSDQVRKRFNENLALLHFKEAWDDAVMLKSAEVWDIFTRRALEQMELEIATKSCQLSKNVNMLLYLNQLEHIENRFLLAGHILLLLGEHDAAEALALAIELGSCSLTEVKMEYAQLLERQGDYRHALTHYEDLLKSESTNKSKNLFAIRAGIARTSIQSGDPWKGRQMAMLCVKASLFTECANIFEGLNLLQDAAEFYDMGGQTEKAVTLYMNLKDYVKVLPLLQKISSPKLFVEYGKAMEAAGNFEDAATAYESSEDNENVVRLLLGPLQNPFKAFATVRKTKSVPGALMAAKFCKNTGDYANAIEFLIVAKRSQEAKELAQQQNKMDVYTELVVDVSSKEECFQLARYYHTMGEYGKAGALLEHCGESNKALKLYLQSGTILGVQQAVELVGRENDEALTNQLLEYVNKEEENAEKNLQHLYQFYKFLGNYEEAARSVSILASREQDAGNYKKAHGFLLDLCLVFQAQGKRIPMGISHQLMLLHSYILAKIHIRMSDHNVGARLLIRIARHITKFPAHVVPILTSTVLECYRSGLSTTAFEFASMLMHPDYRNTISAAYKRKVEKIVRKCVKVEEEETLTPCPMCEQPLPNMQLTCPACHHNIPFCIASGQHMVLGNWSKCPHCKFPALITEFVKMLEVESLCPMCSQPVAIDEIKPISNPHYAQVDNPVAIPDCMLFSDDGTLDEKL